MTNKLRPNLPKLFLLPVHCHQQGCHRRLILILTDITFPIQKIDTLPKFARWKYFKTFFRKILVRKEHKNNNRWQPFISHEVNVFQLPVRKSTTVRMTAIRQLFPRQCSWPAPTSDSWWRLRSWDVMQPIIHGTLLPLLVCRYIFATAYYGNNSHCSMCSNKCAIFLLQIKIKNLSKTKTSCGFRNHRLLVACYGYTFLFRTTEWKKFTQPFNTLVSIKCMEF